MGRNLPVEKCLDLAVVAGRIEALVGKHVGKKCGVVPDADYNVAPTTYQPIIRQSRESGDREIVLARWGLVPLFTKDVKDVKGISTMDARSDTISKVPTWREPFKKRRCLIPADAFFEWPKDGKVPKQPYAFELANAKPFGFAGLWDAWKDKDGHWLQSLAIVTTEANELVAESIRVCR